MGVPAQQASGQALYVLLHCRGAARATPATMQTVLTAAAFPSLFSCLLHWAALCRFTSGRCLLGP